MPAAALPHWHAAVRALVAQGRSRLLSDLAVLAPVLAALAPPYALGEVAAAVGDVARCWPRAPAQPQSLDRVSIYCVLRIMAFACILRTIQYAIRNTIA
jgi:hypothetical protein